MYLKRLELLGFKSFADKTILNFEPGIASIVGPNGCGKSNIFDSIRWVLGEQSVKAMRSSIMEDVIFNGTDKRAGLGFAEVSLTFDNQSKILPVEYSEVTVSRRLFRSGDSEYLLNKTQVRLKDILELFMGTGIGAEAYSLVEQGKIDLIISSRPEDRRMIFDEAAGITKYKSKKREAVNKLEDTENNLLRINDIIIEIKRQITSIERQADKARRYKERFEELKALDLKFSKFQLNNLERERLDIEDKIKQLKEDEEVCNQRLQEANNRISDYNMKIEELEKQISDLKEKDMRFDNIIEKNNYRISVNRERINEITIQKERFSEQKIQLSNRIQAQAQKITELKNQIESFEAINEEKNNTLKLKTASLQEIANAIKNAQELIAKSKLKILDISSSQSKLKNEIIDGNTRMQTHLARKRRLDLEKTKVSGEYSQVKSNLDDIQSRIQSVQSDMGNLDNSRQEKNTQIRSLIEQLDDLRKKIKALEDNKLSLESQKEFIEELKLKYENMPGQIKGVLLTEEKPVDESTGIIGKVTRIEEDTTNYKALMAGFNKNVSAQKSYRLFCEAKYISLDPAKLSQRIDELSAQISQAHLSENSMQSEIEVRQNELLDIEESLHQKEIVLSNEETQKKGILEELSKLQDEMGLLDMELDEINEKLVELETKEKQLSQENGRIESEQQALNELINTNQKLISSKIDEREETTVAIAQLKTELDSLKDKKSAQFDTLHMLEEALKEDYGEASLIEQEELNSQKRSDELEAEIVTLSDEMQKTKVQKEALKQELSEYYSRNDNMVSLVNEQRAELLQVENDLDGINKNHHALEMSRQETSYKEQGIKEKVMQAYKLNLDDIQVDLTEAINHNDVSEQITKLKEKLDAFGTVNLVAIEEYDELKKRYEFLVNQQNDLISAKDSLIKTISKINRTTKEMFVDTFEKIATEFHTYFRMLFGGGDAKLIIMDPDNVLESGIEIIARPPGKKLQSINLMSGGEKALTAIALIFGVFKVRPSPFCVLDEIDAPLDESNIGRFAHILKEFAKQSQFVVITHNKKTMVNSNVLYGITMEETGISKIVSVKFAEDKQESVAVAA